MTYSVRSATVRFGRTVALDDVTVEVPGGSVVAVVGGDGAGKMWTMDLTVTVAAFSSIGALIAGGMAAAK